MSVSIDINCQLDRTETYVVGVGVDVVVDWKRERNWGPKSGFSS